MTCFDSIGRVLATTSGDAVPCFNADASFKRSTRIKARPDKSIEYAVLSSLRDGESNVGLDSIPTVHHTHFSNNVMHHACHLHPVSPVVVLLFTLKLVFWKLFAPQENEFGCLQSRDYLNCNLHLNIWSEISEESKG